MKTRKQATRAVRASNATRDRDVRQEIDRFVRALSSYPERFARQPYLSFQQHLSSLAHAHGTGHTDAKINGVQDS